MISACGAYGCIFSISLARCAMVSLIIPLLQYCNRIRGKDESGQAIWPFKNKL